MIRNRFLLLASLLFSVQIWAQQPLSHPSVSWGMNNLQSDEFNGEAIDRSKWDYDVDDWGTWSWEPENAYISDTVLTLQMQQKTHSRGGKDYYFTSGIVKNKEKATYGYFETSIKASAKGQGTCPAFWLFSKGEPKPTEEGGVQYCEIDAIEIFQIPNQLQRLEMNLHTRILENGELVWKRPGQGNTELCHNSWDAPWDPREEFHTYGVLNRVDSIFWYVDGVLRGSKKNYYWHLPMNVTVSMGLRTPYERYIDGVRTIMPYPDSVPEEGFPTEMYADYVRTWNPDPEIFTNMDKYQNQEFLLDSAFSFECYYDAGNGFKVMEDGITCSLQEVASDGSVVNEIVKADKSVVNTQAGEAIFDFEIKDLTPSVDLPEGNKYVLVPVFQTSKANGELVYLANEIEEVKLITERTPVGVSENESSNALSIISFPNPAMDVLNIQISNSMDADNLIVIYNSIGKMVYQSNLSEGEMLKVDVSEFTSGLYYIKTENSTAKQLILSK